MKKLVFVFAVLWGAVVASMVASLLSVETSISLGALNGVAYSPISIYLALFLVLALFVWLIPVAVCLACCRKFRQVKE